MGRVFCAAVSLRHIYWVLYAFQFVEDRIHFRCQCGSIQMDCSMLCHTICVAAVICIMPFITLEPCSVLYVAAVISIRLFIILEPCSILCINAVLYAILSITVEYCCILCYFHMKSGLPLLV